MTQLKIHRGRTHVSVVSLGRDISGMTFKSEIRAGQSPDADLIAVWGISIIGDGSTGQLRLSLDNSITSQVTETIGYMDVLRVEGGEPYSEFSAPLQVVFIDMPTEPPPDPEV